MPGPANPEKALTDDPVGFFSSHVVIQGVGGTKVKPPPLDRFTLVPSGDCVTYDGDKGATYLMQKASAEAGIRAYWCPYSSDSAQSVALGSEADLMFTAKMDGCSFGIGMPAQDGTVLVCHANVKNDEELDDLCAKLNAVTDPKKRDAMSAARSGLRASKQRQQISGAIGPMSSELAPTLYGSFGTTTFGVRTPKGWRFYFQLYQQKGPAKELFGCFPFPNQD